MNIYDKLEIIKNKKLRANISINLEFAIKHDISKQGFFRLVKAKDKNVTIGLINNILDYLDIRLREVKYF